MLARARSLLIVATALTVCGTARAQGDEQQPAPAPPLPPAQPATPINPETPPPPTTAPPVSVRPPPEPYPRYQVVAPPEAPRVTLAPMAGVQVGGRVDTVIGTLNVDPGGTYGLAVDVRVLRSSAAELSYTYQATSLTLEQPFARDLTLFDLSVHHVQLAFVQDLYPGRLRPFVGIGLGLAVFSPHIARLPDEVQFAFHAQLGLNIQITEALGIRVLGRVISTFFQSDSGVFCSVGTGGGGCSLGVFGGVGQLAFLAGPTLAFF
jgi:hypothetical protein